MECTFCLFNARAFVYVQSGGRHQPLATPTSLVLPSLFSDALHIHLKSALPQTTSSRKTSLSLAFSTMSHYLRKPTASFSIITGKESERELINEPTTDANNLFNVKGWVCLGRLSGTPSRCNITKLIFATLLVQSRAAALVRSSRSSQGSGLGSGADAEHVSLRKQASVSVRIHSIKLRVTKHTDALLCT